MSARHTVPTLTKITYIILMYIDKVVTKCTSLHSTNSVNNQT